MQPSGHLPIQARQISYCYYECSLLTDTRSTWTSIFVFGYSLFFLLLGSIIHFRTALGDSV